MDELDEFDNTGVADNYILKYNLSNTQYEPVAHVLGEMNDVTDASTAGAIL